MSRATAVGISLEKEIVMTTRMAKILASGAAFGAALCFGTFLTSGSAEAQTPRCTNHKNLTDHLEEKYGEKPRSIGVVSEQGLMQVYVSKKGTWTILVTNPLGQACLIAAGKNWEDLKVSFEDPEA